MESAQPIALGQVALRLPAARRDGNYHTQGLTSEYMSPVDTVTIENAVPAANTFDEIEFNLGTRMNQENLPPSLASLLDEIKRHLEEAMKRAREARPDFFERLNEMRAKLDDPETAERLEIAGNLIAATAPESLDRFTESLEAVMSASGPKGEGDESGEAGAAAVQISPVKLALNFDGAKGISVVVDELRMSAGEAGAGGASLSIAHGKLE